MKAVFNWRKIRIKITKHIIKTIIIPTGLNMIHLFDLNPNHKHILKAIVHETWGNEHEKKVRL